MVKLRHFSSPRGKCQRMRVSKNVLRLPYEKATPMYIIAGNIAFCFLSPSPLRIKLRLKIKYPDVFGINFDDRLEATLTTVSFVKVEQYFRNAKIILYLL